MRSSAPCGKQPPVRNGCTGFVAGTIVSPAIRRNACNRRSAPMPMLHPGDRSGALAMSIFYLLPSRPLLGQRFADFLQTVFPAQHWPREQWHDLAEVLGSEVTRRTDTYVVYREDVPDGMTLDEAMVREFGAVLGDEIVEVA